MQLKKLLTVLLLAGLCASAAACAPSDQPADDPNVSVSADADSNGDNAPSTGYNGKTYEQIAATAAVSPSDATKAHTCLGWWDNWARFYTGSVDGALVAKADTIGTPYMDEGRGPFLRETCYAGSTSLVDSAHDYNLKVGTWIEMQGDTRNMLIALHQLEDGTFEQDEKTGSAKMIANAWMWNNAGPGVNEKANYIAWGGVHSFVNNEEWSSPYIIDNYLDQIHLPTYPDGTVAQGYLPGGDMQTPHLARLYDACAAKDINGNVIRYDELGNVCGGDAATPGMLALDDYNNTRHFTDDFAVGKDSSAPFWTEYNAMTADYYVERGTDYFWVDNWGGWDNFNNCPLKRAFGDWSEYKYRELLRSDSSIAGEVDEEFSISQYVKDRCAELDPSTRGQNLLTYSSNASRQPAWGEDQIWLSYMAFKSLSNKAYNSAVYTAIKDSAEKYNGDRESVMVGGNDFPYLTYGACDPDALDIVHTEYNNTYSAATGFNVSGPSPKGYSGHAFSLASSAVRSTQAALWYYGEDVENIGLLYSFEALAYNCTVYQAMSAGTERSAKLAGEAIGKLKDYLGNRSLYAEIGVVFSADSELSDLAPGGFIHGEAVPADTAYMGWCHAFDELNIPYRGIWSNRLDDFIDLCSVLILPNVRAFSQDMIDNILIPWLDRGNTLIITGADAGHIDTIENYFKIHDSNILIDLANSYNGAGKVIFYETDPSMQYYLNHKDASQERLEKYFLSDLRKLAEDFYSDGTLNRLIALENLPEHVLTTLNFDAGTGNFFVDIVNMQYDVPTDTLTNIEAGVKVKVRLPSNLWGKQLDVKLFNSDKRKVVDLAYNSDYTIDGEYAYVTLPELAFYGCVIFTAAQ